jgi:hypothetical protein
MANFARNRQLLIAVMALGIAGQACSLGGLAGELSAASPIPPTAEPLPADTQAPPTETVVSPTATVVHLQQPGEVPPVVYFLSDVSSGGTNQVQRAQAGDNFPRNRLERPFAAPAMDYRADLDIVRVEISADETWFYFTMVLYGADGPQNASLSGPYGIELDLDADGRGDMMIQGTPVAGNDWTTDGVQVWADGNGDVGAARPMEADAPQTGLDGYETLVFDQGIGDDPDAAWMRLALIEDAGVQFAVKRSALGDDTFLWGGWADEGVNHLDWIDYNDTFSAIEAGSLDSRLAAVSAVDNTCRMYFGYTPSGSEPGLCVVTGTVRNCSPHPMRMEPGGTILAPFFDSGSTLDDVRIGSYTFYDESVEGNPSVLTATLSPGGLITITKTGFGDSYPCQ